MDCGSAGPSPLTAGSSRSRLLDPTVASGVPRLAGGGSALALKRQEPLIQQCHDLFSDLLHNPTMGATDSSLSVELLKRIRAGDGAAWEELYLRYRDPLLLSIRCRLSQKLRGRLTSEDILQSVVKDALGDLHKFEHRGPGSLGHYLHACVLNKIRNKADYHDAIKRAGDVPLNAEMRTSLPMASPDEGPEYADPARFGALEHALEQLQENVRELVLLRLVEGLSNLEAAARVGMNPGAASKAYCRGLARLGALTAGDGTA